ncbi:MAG: phytase [Parvularculaceae bacterium]|nr:phytase [Parvularculaceae bacterium]
MRTLMISTLVLVGCELADERPVTDPTVPALSAKVETDPVASADDAADDPAIYIDVSDPARSLILGTDKRVGLNIYDLDGQQLDFIPSGRLNNVDLRPVGTGAMAAATNRSDNSVTLFVIEGGMVRESGRFPTIREEPYGFCMARAEDGFVASVTHKTGEVDLYTFTASDGSDATHTQALKLGEQLEGCVFDEANGHFFVGREATGIDRYTLDGVTLEPTAFEVDRMGGESGIAADVEGLTLWLGTDPTSGYLIASSQGNNTYAVYDRRGETFITRFSVGKGDTVDGTEETDGIDVTSAPLPGFPAGVLIIQDGFNDPEGHQNFKLVDWRDVEPLITNAP